MTMTEPTTAPKPSRKYKRRKRAAAATKREPKAELPPSEFAGMTASLCCVDASPPCSANYCVITEIGICGHPLKGGLQPALMVRPDVVARYGRARKAMAHARIDEKSVL